MARYDVIVEVRVEAESEEEAKQLALNKLRKGQYDRIDVLLHGDLRSLMSNVDDSG